MDPAPSFSPRREVPNEVLLAAIPPTPRTPSPRAKSLVFGYRGSQGAKLIIGGAFTVMGLLFTAIFCWGVPIDLYIATSGHAAQGTVTRTELQRNVEVNGENPTLIHFSYVDAKGVTHQGSSSSLDDELNERAVEGATIPLEVAGSFSRVEGSTYSTFGYVPLFVVLFPVIGVLVLVSAIRSNRKEIAAFVHGVPVMAKVTYSGHDHSVKVNGRHPFKVSWEFFAHDGRVYQGAITSMSQLELEGMFGTQDIPVVYLREDPSTNTVYVP